MKQVKTFLWLGGGLLFIALCFGVYVWYTLQKLSVEPPHIDSAIDTALPTSTADTDASAQEDEAPIIIKRESLSDTQQTVLDTVGIEGEELVITVEMIACAREKLGDERVEEIIQGAAPTPLETLTLLSCVQ